MSYVQVHPDYFFKFLRQKAVNEANIQILSQMFFGSSSSSPNVRYLSFYLKPSAILEEPKKVKVSARSRNRISESIRDILETIGDVDLPPRPMPSSPSETETMSSRFISCSQQQIATFLSSLVDKRELIQWRKDMDLALWRLLEDTRLLLGVDEVDLRFHWSSHNTAVLLRSLGVVIEANREVLCLPWTGMTLAITGEDCIESRVDIAEGCIQISPSQTQLQWLETFMAVTHEALVQSRRNRDDVKRWRQDAMNSFSEELRSGLEESSTRVHKNVKYTWSNRRGGGIRANIVQGFTCNNRWFKHFLENNFPGNSGSSHNSRGHSCGNSTASSSSSSSVSGGAGDDESFAMVGTTSGLVINIVVEQGHGTRVLESGELRLDASLRSAELRQFLRQHTGALITKAVMSIRRRKELELQRTVLMQRLGLGSLVACAGVTFDMEEVFLSAMLTTETEGTSRVKKDDVRKLRGFDVRIGRYLGLANDGSVVLPWDMH